MKIYITLLNNEVITDGPMDFRNVPIYHELPACMMDDRTSVVEGEVSDKDLLQCLSNLLHGLNPCAIDVKWKAIYNRKIIRS